jgi:hypothetical protein
MARRSDYFQPVYSAGPHVLNPEARKSPVLAVNAGFDVLVNEGRIYNVTCQLPFLEA